MIAKQWMITGTTLLFLLSGAPAMGEEKSKQHIQIAEIVVDPAQLDAYKSAVIEQIEAAIRLEPGVLLSTRFPTRIIPARLRCSRFAGTVKLISRTCRHLTS